MGFLQDRKREHEQRAVQCVNAKDFESALLHATQAADLSFQLAEQSEGQVASRYAEVGRDLVEFAKRLKAKVAEGKPRQGGAADAGRKAVHAAGTGDDAGKREKTWQLQEKPTDRLADVAGLTAVKEQLRELVIDPFNHPEVYQRFGAKVGGGVLMYGPPGNGKTFIARAVAGELEAAFFLVDASQVKDKYVGETEKKLTSLFKEARSHTKSVIFLDEVDDLLGSRGNQKIGTVTTFLKLADGFVKDDSCLLILAATNKPWMMSPAVLRPGRLGTHIYVGPPDQLAREAILKYTFGKAPVAGVQFPEVAQRSEGYSGAELAEVCERAKRRAIRRQIESGHEESVTAEDLAACLAEVRPQTGPVQLAEFDRWREGRENAAAGSSGERDDDDDE